MKYRNANRYENHDHKGSHKYVFMQAFNQFKWRKKKNICLKFHHSLIAVPNQINFYETVSKVMTSGNLIAQPLCRFE